MKILLHVLLAAIAFGGLAAPCAAADAKPCGLVRVTTLDMTLDQLGRVQVPMTIGGHTVNLLVDTGGIDSMLTEATANALGLHIKRLNRPDLIISGFGGWRVDHFATATNISFGGLVAEHRDFMIFSGNDFASDLAGTVAPDILRAYDDEFDFANAKLGLFSREHCHNANLAYWTKDEHAEIPFELDRWGHIDFQVELDGKTIHCVLDTGSDRSFTNLEQMEDLFGFKENDPALKTLETGHSYKYPFKTLSFGGVTVSSPDLVLVPQSDSRMGGFPTLILGMGIFRQLHMYIAYAEQKLYVTPASAH